MSEPVFCLRRDVVVEPLVARWHAWPHLISPVTAGLNAAYRHIRTMESYVEVPQLHAAAARDPALLGGAFVDLGGERVEDVAALIEWTRERQAPGIALAAGVNACWKLLTNEADGHGLAPLYAQLPEELRGVVEMVYTPANAPDLRLNEPLLYRSACYDPTLQGAMLRRIAGDDRPFALSTPRLDGPDRLYLDLPFADPAYDLLGSLRSHPRPLAEIVETLRIDSARQPLFESFLTDTVPLPAPVGKARWRYFGHACVLVETAQGRTVLVDPVIAYESGVEPERFSVSDLPERIDYVLITHNHADHALLETLLALRWKVGTVVVPANGGSLVDPSLRLALSAAGFADVRELTSLDVLIDEDLRVTALPFLGEHADLDIRAKAAWLVETGNHRLLFAADSNAIDPQLYARLRPLVGRIDTLFLGMECRGAPMSWLYGCLLPFVADRGKDQSRRLDGSDSKRALDVVRTLDVARVCVYAMGLEPWLTFITGLVADPDSEPMKESERLIAECGVLGIPAERLYGRTESSIPG